MNDMMNKIAALLNKAERTDNQHEAEAFTAKAETLMMKYGIERAHLDDIATKAGKKTEEIVIHREVVVGTRPKAKLHIAVELGRGLGNTVKVYKSTIGSKQMLWVVGHQSDIDDFLILYRSLVQQASHQQRLWWAREGRHAFYSRPSEQGHAKREFEFAFGTGVRTQLEEVRRSVMAEAAPGTDLVLFDRSKKVEQWIGMNMQFSKSRSRSLMGGGQAARSAGFQAGKQAQTRKSLG